LRAQLQRKKRLLTDNLDPVLDQAASISQRRENIASARLIVVDLQIILHAEDA
jgi:hypothetical protein